MTNVFTENWTGGTPGQAIGPSNSLWSVGAGAPVFAADGYSPGGQCARFVSTGTAQYLTMAITAITKAYPGIVLRVVTNPAKLCNFLQMKSGGTNVCTGKVTPTGHIGIQDGTGTPAGSFVDVWTSSTVVTAYDDIVITCDPTGAGVLQVDIYAGSDRGSGSPTETSGPLTLTNTGVSIDTILLGIITATAAEFHVGAPCRLNNSVRPASVAPGSGTAPLAVQASADHTSPVEPGTLVTITSLVTGGSGSASQTLTQTDSSGWTAPILGTGPWQFWTPRCFYDDGIDLTFEVIAVDGATTATASIDLHVPPHNTLASLPDGEIIATVTTASVGSTIVGEDPAEPPQVPIGTAPTGVTATGGATGSPATVSWTPMADPTSNERIIWYAVLDANDGTVYADRIPATDTSASVTMPGDDDYDVYVIGRTALRYSKPSNTASFTQGAGPAVLPAPTSFAVSGSGRTRTFTWTKTPDPAATSPVLTYQLVDGSGNPYAGGSVDASQSSITYTFTASGTYVVAVIALTQSQVSAASNTQSVTI